MWPTNRRYGLQMSTQPINRHTWPTNGSRGLLTGHRSTDRSQGIYTRVCPTMGYVGYFEMCLLLVQHVAYCCSAWATGRVYSRGMQPINGAPNLLRGCMTLCWALDLLMGKAAYTEGASDLLMGHTNLLMGYVVYWWGMQTYDGAGGLLTGHSNY